MKKYTIEMRVREGKRWSEWGAIVLNVTEDTLQEKLQWWRELNQYAVDARGESARREFRAIEESK